MRKHPYRAPWYADDPSRVHKAMGCTIRAHNERQQQQRATREDIQGMMEHTAPWIAFVGDSIARNVLLSLLVQIGAGDTHDIVFERHADYEYKDPRDRFKVTLHWAPFPQNASDVIQSWMKREQKNKDMKLAPNHTRPSVVVVSVTLWHVLHIHDESSFERDMHTLRLVVESSKLPTIVLNAPEVFVASLTDAAKKMYMVPERIDAYNTILTESLFLNHPSKSLVFLDVFNETYACGPPCTIDGIHSKDSVYDTMVHILVTIVTSCIG